MGRRSKALVLAIVLGVSAISVQVYRVRASKTCPKASSIYSYENFPTTQSSDAEIRSFVTGNQFYGEIEGWTKAENCSGNRVLVGRILATAVKERQEVLLASMYGAVIDSEKGRSKSEMATDLSVLLSADLPRKALNAGLLAEKVSAVREGEIKFARGLFDSLSESLDPDMREAFKLEATVDRLAKQK